MRSARSTVWAVGLLLGMSGCAGVQQRGSVPLADGTMMESPSAAGFRGRWARRFGGGEAAAVRSDLGAIPPAGAFRAASGDGWGGVFQFSKPPWVTRQPQRAPIFSLNRSGVPAQPKMSAVEINEAIARMTAGRRDDDQVLPVRNVEEPRVAAREDDRDEPSILSRPIALPDALANVPHGESPDPAERTATPPVPNLLDAREEAESVAIETSDVDPLAADPIEETAPAVDRLAMANPALESMAREIHDDGLVRSSQIPPAPPIRPEPGVEPPAADPIPSPPSLDVPKVEDAPKPAEAPKVEEAPKPAEAPKVEEAPKPAEAPKVEEAPKPVDTPKPAEAPKVEEAPKPADAPKSEPKDGSDDQAPPPIRNVDASAVPPVAPAQAMPVAQAPVSAIQSPTFPPTPAAQTPIYSAPVVSAFPEPAPKAHRWSFWNWKSSRHEHEEVGAHQAQVSPQSLPAQLPPATFPTSYESVWAKPLVPCPSPQIEMASPQARLVVPSPQGTVVEEKASCWLVDRLKTRAHQLKVWKHEHICKHIQDFKAALKGEKCHACSKSVTPSPQARPTPQATPSPQEWPMIGGSRFGLY